MERVLGVDVSKDYLDVDFLPNAQPQRFRNDADGTEKLLSIDQLLTKMNDWI